MKLAEFLLSFCFMGRWLHGEGKLAITNAGLKFRKYWWFDVPKIVQRSLHAYDSGMK